MSKQDDFKLDVLSRIDEDIIDRNMQKRYMLSQYIKTTAGKLSKKAKLWIFSAGGVAAAVVIALIGAFLFGLFGGKQVPIYRGMSVSSIPSQAEANASDPLGHVLLDASGSVPVGETGGTTGETTEVTTAPDSLEVEGAEQIYYANPGERVLITVHIENPDDFEILSFTLNGKKYANNMFEPNSDLQHLILAVDVASEPGMQEFTIDAIKYVDGTDIKDVRMEGDRTVKVGISYQTLPTAEVVNKKEETNAVTLEVKVEDLQGVIAGSKGLAQLALLDGENVIAVQPLAVNDTTLVRFDNLEKEHNYHYKVVFTYDKITGEGYRMYDTANGAIKTLPYLTVSLTPHSTSADFALTWDHTVKDGVIDSIKLFRNRVFIKDIPTDATLIDGLIPSTGYILSVAYRCKGENEELRYNFISAPVNYRVEHWVEGIEDDDYHVEITEANIGSRGERVTAKALDPRKYVGFVLESEPTLTQVIADDSSTVFRFYYKRARWTVTYISNNGEPAYQTTVKYNANANSYVPTRAEDEFVGWYSAPNFKLSDRVTNILSDSKLYARWEGETLSQAFDVMKHDTYCTLVYSYWTGAIVVPAYIDGLPVAEVDMDATGYMKKLELPNTVTTIKSFGEASLIEKLVIPSSVTSIDPHAFDKCQRIVEVYNLSDCELPFTPMLAEYDSMLDSGTTYATLNSIRFVKTADNKFYCIGSVSGYTGLISNLPTDLKHVFPEWTENGEYEIARNAFVQNVTHISIPACVTKIGESAFGSMEALQTIEFSSAFWVEIYTPDGGTPIRTDVNFSEMTNNERIEYLRERTQNYSWEIKRS